MLSFTLITILLNIQLLANGYPDGAPTSACDSLIPIHGVSPQLKESLQYVVEVDRNKVPENGRVKITLKSPQFGYTISGFMVQAQTTMDQFPRTIGSFIEYPIDISKGIHCLDSNDTLTHTGSSSKEKIVAVWQAPRGFVGSIVFNATIAESFSKFWTNVMSIPIQVLPTEIFGGSIPEPIFPTTPAWKTPAYTFDNFTPKQNQDKKETFVDTFYNNCFKSKNCFGAPKDCIETKDCEVATTILAKRDTYEFELLATNPRSAYAAVALSFDDKMGDDSVMECVRHSPNSLKAFMSWTTGRSIERLNSNNGIQLLNQSVTADSLYCRISRDVRTKIQNQTFDLVHDKHHLLVATGSHIHSNKVGYHDIAYLAAAEPIALADVRPIGAASDILIRLHGSLMFIAWIGFASSGILIARYYRQTWVNKSFFGKDIWFALHRFLMVLTWLFTLIALVLIFIELRGWSNEKNPHAILGVFTAIICFFQPIVAYFRPHPGTPKRPIFNWLHWLAGNTAFTLAIITIFFAVRLNKAQLPEWFDYILLAYIIFYIIIHLVLSILGCVSNKTVISPEPVYRPNSFAMKDMASPRTSTATNSIVKMDSPVTMLQNYMDC